MHPVDKALGNGNLEELRQLVASASKGGTEPPLTPVLRVFWSRYWMGKEEIDHCVRVVRPLFPRCGDSLFHPDLTLEDGLRADNPRLVCELLEGDDLTEGQIEGVLGLWHRLLLCGNELAGAYLGEHLLERYPFLCHEPSVGQLRGGDILPEGGYQLSNLSRVILAARKEKEIRYELS